MTTVQETLTITLPAEAGSLRRETRVLYAAPDSLYGPDYEYIIKLIVDTPSTLVKDNDYRQGAERAEIDAAPLRFFGHVKRQLNAARPTRSGWAVWFADD